MLILAGRVAVLHFFYRYFFGLAALLTLACFFGERIAGIEVTNTVAAVYHKYKRPIGDKLLYIKRVAAGLCLWCICFFSYVDFC